MMRPGERSRRRATHTEGFGAHPHQRKWADLALPIPPRTPASGVRPGTGGLDAEERGAPISTPSWKGPTSAAGAFSIPNVGKGGENQDTFVASANMNGSKHLVGVFDGHGEQGRRISEFVRLCLARELFGHKELHTNPVVALESAYQETQRQIERNHSMEASYSGTTALAAYRHRDHLFVANVGDSRAVLGRCMSAEGDESKGLNDDKGLNRVALKAVELSSDQKPCREDERRRILSMDGGAVHPSTMVRGMGGTQARVVRLGPERVWDRAGRCGLGVSRSLGDLNMRPYVIAQPEVCERLLDNRDMVLILASDGVWDRVGSQEAVDIAAKHDDPGTAAREITGVARKRWHAETRGQLSDDITAVVVRLDHTPGKLESGTSSMPVRAAGAREALAPLHSREGTREGLAPLPSREGARDGLAPLPSREGGARSGGAVTGEPLGGERSERSGSAVALEPLPTSVGTGERSTASSKMGLAATHGAFPMRRTGVAGGAGLGGGAALQGSAVSQLGGRGSFAATAGLAPLRERHHPRKFPS